METFLNNVGKMGFKSLQNFQILPFNYEMVIRLRQFCLFSASLM